jgi:thymidylate kinase
MISFSGIDCAGKTTQIELLEQYYLAHGQKVKRIWARGRCTPGVVLIKNIVRTDKNLDEAGKKEYREQIHKSSKKRRLLLIASILDLYWYFGLYYRLLNIFHKNLICDRYLWDSYIDFKVDYSEFNFEKWIIWKQLPGFVLKPKVSFMFIIPPEESIRRGIQKKEAGLQTLEQKREKINQYMQLVKVGKWTNVIEGMRDIDDISREIREVLNLED